MPRDNNIESKSYPSLLESGTHNRGFPLTVGTSTTAHCFTRNGLRLAVIATDGKISIDRGYYRRKRVGLTRSSELRVDALGAVKADLCRWVPRQPRQYPFKFRRHYTTGGGEGGPPSNTGGRSRGMYMGLSITVCRRKRQAWQAGWQ